MITLGNHDGPKTPGELIGELEGAVAAAEAAVAALAAEARDASGEEEDRAHCPEHGWQAVTGSGSYTGFAGGGCSWWTMACGCTSADESADLRAAR